MVKFIATSDVHGNLKNLEPFKVVIRRALSEARNRKCPLFIGGDLNDTKAVLRSEFVQFLIDSFLEYKDVQVIVLIGNHDLCNHFSNTDHSLGFLKILPNLTVIDEAQEIFPEWYAIPYHHRNQDILEQLQIAKDKGYRKIFLHQGIMGAKQSEYILDKSSITLEDLKDFDRVFLGHYHSHQTLGMCTYWGSPFTVSFAEANQDKFIWYVEDDGAEIKLVPIRPGARRHLQISWDEGEEAGHVLPEHNKDDIIKIVARGSKEFCLSLNKEAIKTQYGLENLQLTTEIRSTNRQRIDASQIHKPMEVINAHLENSETSLDKNDLRRYLGRISEGLSADCDYNMPKDSNQETLELWDKIKKDKESNNATA